MKRKLLILALIALAFGALYYFSRQVTLDQVAAEELRLRAFLRNHPATALLAGFLVYVAASLVPATSGKSLVYGWLFGFWQAVVLVNFGLTAAAVITFLFSRYVFADAIQSRFGLHLTRMNRALARDGGYYLVVLRLVHFPYTLTNYAMGVTSIRPGTFWWATQLGLLPGNLVFVYAGTQLPSLDELARHGLLHAVSPQLIVALVVVSLFPLLMRWAIRRAWPRLRPAASHEAG